MPKNILMVAYTNYLTDARPRREAETLAARGDRVIFISLAEENKNRDEVINGVHIHRVSFERYRSNKISHYIFNYCRFFIVASFLTCVYFWKYSLDVIYIHTMPDFMVFVALVPKMFGAKVILNIHDMMPELYMSKFRITEDFTLIRILKFQEKISCAFADRVICVHHPHKHILEKRGVHSDKLFVLMNLPDHRIFGSARELQNEINRQLRLLYHGTIARRFGLDLAVDAFALVLKEFPEALFEIYGDGDGADELALKISSLHLERNILFHRKMFTIDIVPSIIMNATVGLIPNRKNIATEYMLPVKLLEYVYLGLPVIAPSLKTIQYYFPESSLVYYEAENVIQLAASISRLFKNKEERRELSLSACKFTRTYNWVSVKEELFSIIDR